MAQMKAIGQTAYGGVEVLTEITVPKPVLSQPRDLLIRVKAVATNPVDYKKRTNWGKGGAFPSENGPLILGWDGAGVVEQVGAQCSLFKVGDEVYFAGSILRPGCNAEFTLVDERIVGRKPKNLSFEEAATIPLTGITAWEGLIDQMEIPIPRTANEKKANMAKTVIVIGGAGGVGSIAIQIAKKILNLRVIATASREETSNFCKSIGADFIIDHTKNFADEMKRIGIPEGAEYVYDTFGLPSATFEKVVQVMKPFGKVVTIVEQPNPVNISAGMSKGIHWIWELMFTRPIFGVDLETQHLLLNELADLVEKGVIVPRMTQKFNKMSQLAEAHKIQESGRAIGKLAITLAF